MKKHIFLILFLFFPKISSAQMLDWHLAEAPTTAKSQAYGSHSAGCMDGGRRLPDEGIGYILGDVHENRAYGQPEMLSYIAKLSERFYKETRNTLIISDISSPRGGPVPITSSLHQSHQTGLDVDIWLKTAAHGENPHQTKQSTMIRDNSNQVSRYWGEAQVSALKNAASFPEVDRIFINPIIKNELCRHYAGAPWMNKIRPWWGHAAHFHVRLKCPENQPGCVMQGPVPQGDGCGKNLEWWFSPEATTDVEKEPRKYPVLPEECNAVFARP